MNIELILIFCAIIFISGIIRTTFGFGAGLIAMPLLLMFIPIRTASPIIAVVSLIVAGFLLIKSHNKIEIRKSWKLILAGFLGIPVGLFLLQDQFRAVVCIALGIIIIIFALFKLLHPSFLRLHSDRSSIIFGFFSGILGGAYNVEGPPIIIYGTMRDYPPQVVITTLQAVVFPLNIVIIIGHFISGNFTPLTNQLILYLLIPLTISMFIGSWLHKKISAEKFIRYIYIFLIILGILLIVKYL
jgi:uncharacterized membrane protein YfcA